MSNSKIYTTSFNKNELNAIFNNIKSRNSNLLYTNCISKIKIGNYFLSRQFDTYFYSPENDATILIERDDNKTNSDVRNYLLEKNIFFNEVRFANIDVPYEDCDISKIRFAREKDNLIKEVQENILMGHDTCVFYPKVTGELIINANNMLLDKRSTKGLLVFPDKYVFIMNEFDPRNMNMGTVASTLIDLNMNIIVNQEEYPQELLKESKGSKILCKKI